MPVVHLPFEGYVDSPTLDPKDPYGIANVSGFYGPGTWAGWFLAIIASSVRIYTKPHAKVDPNTWLFVIGTNWAAIDIFRTLPRIWLADEAAAKAIGPLCASLAVTFWGNVYATVQVLVLLAVNPLPTQRLLTHVVGFIMPTIALNCVGFSVELRDQKPLDKGIDFLLGGVDLVTIPFLYFGGEFDKRWRLVFLMGCFSFVFTFFAGLCVALVSIFLVWVCRTQTRLVTLLERVASYMPRRLRPSGLHIFICLVLVLPSIWMFAGVALIVLEESFWRKFFGVLPLWLLIATMFSIFYLIILLFLGNAMYIIGLFASGFKQWSAACYYMPFAPQSILEWDQAYSLVVGIILLFGVEIYPAVARYRENRNKFKEDMERRMEEARARRSHAESVPSLDIASGNCLQTDGLEMEVLDSGDELDDPLTLVNQTARSSNDISLLDTALMMSGALPAEEAFL
ncbi:MAG: hypothetical protein M1820_002028 [Bogoriella megaspora]|nr:MAG: hypothetical protein M1820_002028 [Bogoriella megaspora]